LPKNTEATGKQRAKDDNVIETFHGKDNKNKQNTDFDSHLSDYTWKNNLLIC